MAKSTRSTSATGWQDPLLKDRLMQLSTRRERLDLLKSMGLIDFFGDSPFIDSNMRITMMARVGGKDVPFYISTGTGGKKDVASGKWYPFFGIGKHSSGDDWFIKLGGDRINANYGSKVLGSIKDVLDSVIGDVSEIPGGNSKDLASQRAALAAHEAESNFSYKKANDRGRLFEAERRLSNLNGRSLSNINQANDGGHVEKYVDEFVKDIDAAAGANPRARRKPAPSNPVSQALTGSDESVSGQLGAKPAMPATPAAPDSSEGVNAALANTMGQIRSRASGFASLGPQDPGRVLPKYGTEDVSGKRAPIDADYQTIAGPARVRVNGKVFKNVGRVRLPNGSIIDLSTHQGRRQFKRVKEALGRSRVRQAETQRTSGNGFTVGTRVPLLTDQTKPPYPPLNKAAAKMSVNPLKASAFMKYAKGGIGAAIGLGLAGAFIKSQIDERRADEKRHLLLQKQARGDLIDLMGRREYKQSLEGDIQRNLQSLQMKAPDLYMRVAAGRVLPQGAVVIGGVPRTDLLNELGMAMANGQFSQ